MTAALLVGIWDATANRWLRWCDIMVKAESKTRYEFYDIKTAEMWLTQFRKTACALNYDLSRHKLIAKRTAEANFGGSTEGN